MIQGIFVVLAKLVFGFLACIAFDEALKPDGGVIEFALAVVCTFFAVIMSFIPVFG